MFSRQSINQTKVYDLADGDLPLSEHFRLSEFRCNDGSTIILVHPALVDLLEAVRAKASQKFGLVTITINSAYRTVAYNKSIGGAPRSQHIKGMAADIKVKHNGRQIPPADVARVAEGFDPGGIGTYRTFTHLDVYEANRRWRG